VKGSAQLPLPDPVADTYHKGIDMTHCSDTGPFAMIPERVLDAPISDRAFRLYGVLGLYADDSGKCWPSRAALADLLRCSLYAVDRALAELDDLEAIRRNERPQ